jgi:hypothetical protein
VPSPSEPGALLPEGEPVPLVRDDAPRASSRPGRRRTAMVVLPLLVGLAAVGGTGGRMLLGETGDPASATDTVTCWDGEEAESVRQCSRPRGVDGLARVFASFRPAELECFDELERNPSYNRPAMWTCTQTIGGRPVSVTYSEVTARKPAVRFFDDLHGEDARGVVRDLRGGATAYIWTPQATEGAWEGSLLLREGPFAVTVRAELRSDASRALQRRVLVRPPEEWRADLAPDD